MENIKFRFKFALSFGVVAVVVLVLVIITGVTSLQRKNELTEMQQMTDFEQQANTIVIDFSEAKSSAIEIFNSLYAKESYTDIYNSIDSMMQSIDSVQAISRQLNGYYEDVISEIEQGLIKYRSDIQKMEEYDSLLLNEIENMQTDVETLTTSAHNLLQKFNENLQNEIAASGEDSKQAANYFKNVLLPTQQLILDIDDFLFFNERLRWEIDLGISEEMLSIGADLKAKINSLSSNYTQGNDKMSVLYLSGALDSYIEKLENVFSIIDEFDKQAYIAEEQTVASQQQILMGIEVIKKDVAQKLDKIMKVSTIGAYASIIIAAFGVLLCLLMSKLLTSSVLKRLYLMQELLMQVGIKGNMHFTEEKKLEARKAAETKDELGRSLLDFTRMMDRLVYISEQLGHVADGDLQININLLGDEDTMGIALKKTAEKLNDMLSEINIVAKNVAASSGEIAQGSQSLAQGASEQASTIEEISASIEDIAQQSSQSAQTATEVAKRTSEIMQVANTGNDKMANMMEAVEEITQASYSIEKVIKVINDIAFQTNILALNAAVEAARAGQHGKGFAVVADEVRSLAAKSASAAEETAVMIQTSVDKSRLGMEISKDTAQALEEIVGGVKTSAEEIQKLAEASENSRTATEQLSTAVDQVATVVQHNSATSEQSAAASSEMNNQALALQQMVGQFKLKDVDAPRHVVPQIEASI